MTKLDFDKELRRLHELEARAKASGLDSDKKAAEVHQSVLMSFEGMTRSLEVSAMSQGEAFRNKVVNLIERKDVEEIHRLWLKNCRKR